MLMPKSATATFASAPDSPLSLLGSVACAPAPASSPASSATATFASAPDSPLSLLASVACAPAPASSPASSASSSASVAAPYYEWGVHPVPSPPCTPKLHAMSKECSRNSVLWNQLWSLSEYWLVMRFARPVDAAFAALPLPGKTPACDMSALHRPCCSPSLVSLFACSAGLSCG